MQPPNQFVEPSDTSLISQLRKIVKPLEYDSDLESLLQETDNKRFVLLGEASHGTSEFYLWRRALTKQIISHQNVSFIAVEGDWPDCYRVNRYIKGYPDAGNSAEEVLRHFARWPTWMWANTEMIDLIEWLKEYNTELQPHKKIGFYGMDVYSLWESLEQVLSYLSSVHPKEAKKAQELYSCFEPYGGDPDRYTLSTAYIPEGCEKEVLEVLKRFIRRQKKYPLDDEAAFNAEQNAFIAAQAEKYYRSMLKGDVESWNNRDRSMVDTLYRLERFYADNNNIGTVIVWAHNTHIGDARFTDMIENQMWNVGQLLRQEIGEAYVYILGFATYQGSVLAAERWDAPAKIMKVPPARKESWDSFLAASTEKNSLFVFSILDEKKKKLLAKMRGQRAIGVVYAPMFEYGNYVPTLLALRFNSVLFIKDSHASHPLHVVRHPPEFPETYPSAM